MKVLHKAYVIENIPLTSHKKIPLASHNGSDYDGHFIIKEIPEELEKNLGENTEKYITFVFQ